jgi:hypothetical protein
LTEAKTHTITFKGQNNGEPWLVLGGATPDELEAALWAAFPELDDGLPLPEALWRAHALWMAVRAVVVGGLVQAPAPVPTEQPAYGTPGPQAPAQGGSQPDSPPPSCQHGVRIWRAAKPGSGKTWKGWFCPTPMGTSDQCKPQFV